MTPVINSYLINFPNSGHELVTENEDGSYTILINAKLSEDEQRKAYDHALKHIENNDFEKTDVQKIEAEAHGLTTEKPETNKLPAWAEKRLAKLKKQRAKIKQDLADYEETMAGMDILSNDVIKLERQRFKED